MHSLHRRNQLLHTVDRSDELLNAVHLLHNDRLSDDLLNNDALPLHNHTLTHGANGGVCLRNNCQRGNRNQSEQETFHFKLQIEKREFKNHSAACGMML